MKLTRTNVIALASIACSQLISHTFAAETSAPAAATSPAPLISRVTGVAADPNWAEEYAYALGVQAYVYAFPWYYNSLLRWKWTTQTPPNNRTPSMALNTFFHGRVLSDASYRDGGSVNNDTLYSTAWIDLRKEPMIISVPDVGTRYFAVEFAGFDSDNFDYISTRTTGTQASHYALVGPHWKGKLPPGIKALKPAHTPVIFAVARYLIDGPDDLPTVFHLQDQTTLTPLSLWGKKGVTAPENRDVFAPYNPKNDALADWKTINRALTEILPPTRDADLLKQFATIGIGPDQDVEKVDAATRRGLLRALAAGKRIVTGAASDGGNSTNVNGWRINPAKLGRLGLERDFLSRAGVQSLWGIVANDPEESTYPQITHDASGERLTGKRRYVLRFAKDALPPARSFWSLTAYGMDYNMIDNPINRYSLGNRSKTLTYDADGGLSLYIQQDAPGAGKDGNWLPTGEAEFSVMLRIYLPEQRALDGHWQPPVIQRIE